MGPETLNHLRVVVHINEHDHEERNNTTYNTNNSTRHCSKSNQKHNMSREMIVRNSPPIRTLHTLSDNSGCNNMMADIIVIDEKSLQLNLISTEEDDFPSTNISHKMHFDNVSQATVELIKCEMAIVMDDLLLKHKNCSIMRFVSKQEMDLNIFFDLFVTFLTKRIYHQKYKLQYVKLECLDIAASMMNSQNSVSEMGFAMRANLTDLRDHSDDDCNNNNYHRFGKTIKNEFYSTRELLLWLINEYNYKCTDNKDHEKLLFTFSLVDNHKNLFKVKLSLFNIYLDLMNTEDRSHWHHYMDHLGEGCQGLDCNFVHTGLSISLSGHIEGIASQSTLLLFDIPTDITMTADTIEMLQMAHSVIKNRKRKNILLSKSTNNINRRMSLSINHNKKEQLKNNLTETKRLYRRTSLPLLKANENNSITSLTMPYNIKYPNYNNNNNTMNEKKCNKYSSKDFYTLSGWYRKIDESYAKICQKRERYFNRYFELKIKQVTTNIQQMFKSLESLYTLPNEQSIGQLQKDQLELHELYESYDQVRIIFRQLAVDIKKSDFKEILKIYLETKVFDLNNHAIALKQKHLEMCDQSLKFTFNKLSKDIHLLEI